MEDEERKERILQAAERVFADHGYANASIDLIAQKAKMSRRTIYRFFNSKDALFAEIVLGSVPSWPADAEVAGDSLECDVFRLMIDIVDRTYTPRHVRSLQLAVSEIDQSPQLAALLRKGSVNRGRQFLADGLRAVFKAHRLPLDQDFVQWSDMLFGAVVAAPILHALVGDWRSQTHLLIERRIRKLASLMAAERASAVETVDEPPLENGVAVGADAAEQADLRAAASGDFTTRRRRRPPRGGP